MGNFPTFAQVLDKYITQRGLSNGRLAKLAGLAKRTVGNWREGRVKSPRCWPDILRAANALRLTYQEVEALLQPTKHPSLIELWARAGDREQALFKLWGDKIRSPSRVVPFQAPPDLPYFVGRGQELDKLQTQLTHNRTIYVLQGMGGVGKTALATRVAYQMRDYFPDGVLWARVDTSDTMSILHSFATAYAQDVPRYNDLASRCRVVRDMLGKKHALIVFDNVECSAQIEPLLPPTTGNCAVLIITRCRNLSVTRGRAKLRLRPFDRAEAIALFCQILNDQTRVQRELCRLTEIADLLGHLPLGIAICADHLLNPSLSATRLLARLRRGKLCVIEDEGQSVRACFKQSYDTFPPELQSFFATLGVFGGKDFSLDAVAYVTQMPRSEAEDNLQKLYNLSLVRQERPERYQLHPLLRYYARQKINHPQVHQRMVDFGGAM